MNKQKVLQKIYKFISLKLNTCIITIYAIAVLVCLFFPTTPLVSNTNPNAEITDDSANWFYNLSDGRYGISSYTKETKPEKDVIYQITTTLPDTIHKNYAIMFTSKNCRITVFAGGDPIYQTFSEFNQADVPYMGKKVHVIGIPNSVAGRTIDIYFQPVTEHDSALIDTIYAGDESLLTKTYVKENIAPFSISILIIILSIMLTIIGALNHKRLDGQAKFYFGLFSLCFGLFSITHINILTLFTNCSTFLYELEFLTLALLPYPAICYIMAANNVLPTIKHTIIKLIPLVNFLFVVLMQLTGWMPLNQTRPGTLLMILYFAIVIGYYLIQKQIKQKPWKNLNENGMDYVYLLFLISCVVEFVLFHAGVISSFLVISHYLLLFILLSQLIIYTKKAHKLVEIGTNAKHLEDAAFFDSLTGLRNRASLNQDIEDLEKTLHEKSAIALIQLDINYLKRTNDILGHIAGDRLLKNAAKAILAGFDDYGNCYRMGGDEFIVILENNPKEKYNLGISAMENACDKINKTLPQLEHVSIAYGIAYYEPNSDTSLWRVQERADVIMYERKRAMKEKKASNKNYQDDRL